MTVTESRGRRDQRPEWLQQKHSQRPANPKLADWADRTLDDLYGIWAAQAVGPYKSQQAAQAAKNALYDATYKRWNRRNPGEQLSLSANVTDPGDGRCYARGTCRCGQNGCQPTPGPGWFIHTRLYDKSQGRAQQGAKPREQWDYDPMNPRSRHAGSEPSRAFGAGNSEPVEEEPPSRLRRRAPQAESKPAARPAPNADAQSFGEKLRRWTS